jgi:hypothetical protein
VERRDWEALTDKELCQDRALPGDAYLAGLGTDSPRFSDTTSEDTE